MTGVKGTVGVLGLEGVFGVAIVALVPRVGLVARDFAALGAAVRVAGLTGDFEAAVGFVGDTLPRTVELTTGALARELLPLTGGAFVVTVGVLGFRAGVGVDVAASVEAEVAMELEDVGALSMTSRLMTLSTGSPMAVSKCTSREENGQLYMTKPRLFCAAIKADTCFCSALV